MTLVSGGEVWIVDGGCCGGLEFICGFDRPAVSPPTPTQSPRSSTHPLIHPPLNPSTFGRHCRWTIGGDGIPPFTTTSFDTGEGFFPFLAIHILSVTPSRVVSV
ncbi:hypothetical protein QCA50_007713 [Cerrena zonata]|uniref:Uncharacterized protein n=1 Tax=Cerrena zonata TaxID=2478898 RepID=A0AAW0GGB4_9APHY